MQNANTMKIKNFLLVLAAFVLTNVAAVAQEPYDVESSSEYDIIMTTNPTSPSIEDFITALLAEPEDELNGMLSDAWQRYLTGQPAEKGGTMLVDKKNGFMSYTVDYDEMYPEDAFGMLLRVEMCYWNCADGKHKLVAQNVVSTHNGKPALGQYDGMMFYLYDIKAHKLSPVYSIIEDYEGDYEIITYELPQKGKNIKVHIHTSTGVIDKLLVWDGYRFKFGE